MSSLDALSFLFFLFNFYHDDKFLKAIKNVTVKCNIVANERLMLQEIITWWFNAWSGKTNILNPVDYFITESALSAAVCFKLWNFKLDPFKR